MKIRTLRTYDELVAFHRLVGEQYPDYWEHARLAHVYYGVFDVGDDSVAWGEGDVLFAGAAVNLGTWDLLRVEGDASVRIEHLIVERGRRDRGIGGGLLRFLVDAHCDRDIRLSISPMDEVERLKRLYGRYRFKVSDSYFGDVVMVREPDEDDDWDAAERLRGIAVGERLTESRAGIDMAESGYLG